MIERYSRRSFQIDREFKRMISEIDIMFEATEERLTSVRDYVFMGNSVRALYDGMERLFEMILSFSRCSATDVVNYHSEVLSLISPILEFDRGTQKDILGWQKLSHFFHHGYSHQVKPRNVAEAMTELPDAFSPASYGVIDFWNKHGVEIETTRKTLEEPIDKLQQMKREFMEILNDMNIKDDENLGNTSSIEKA